MKVIDLSERRKGNGPPDDPLAILKATVTDIESGKRPMPAAMLLIDSDVETMNCTLVTGDCLQALGMVAWAYAFLRGHEEE